MSSIINIVRSRGAVVSVVFAIAVLAMAVDARAVILYSTPDRNTEAPLAAMGLDAWNLQAAWGSYLTTPIDATHFIAAKHLNTDTFDASTIAFQGEVYTVDESSRVADPGSDLVIYSIVGGTFSNYATLYDATVDGSEIGKTVAILGRGTQRGAAVNVDGELAGWHWGSADHLQSWGQNVVDEFYDYNSSSEDSVLYFGFDADGLADEAALSIGDSSGGVFIYSNGEWKLAGINWAVDGPFKDDINNEEFNASIFDARGLYYNDGDDWALIEGEEVVVAGSYASRISDRRGWISSVVPEPGSVTLLISAAVFLSAFGFAARQR